MDQDAIIQWLMSGGSLEDIFGPPGGGELPYFDEDTQDYLNKRGTFQKKANDLMSDQATIAQLGLNAGGVTPEAFEPTITYEPVKAPAYMRLMQMEGSDDPVSRIIAQVMLNKGTALQAEDAVLQYLNESGTVPASLQDPDTNGVDRARLQRLTTDIEQMTIDDPVFTAFDPKTGMPANAVDENGNPIVPHNGGYASRIETPSETAEYFREMNLPSPFETYDPDIFAGEGDLAREAKTYDDESAAMTRYMLADAARGVDTGEYGGSDFGAPRKDVMQVKADTVKSDLADPDIRKAYQGILDEEAGSLLAQIQESSAPAPSLFGDTLAPGVRDAGSEGDAGRESSSMFRRSRRTQNTPSGDAMRGAMSRYGNTDDMRRVARARAGQSLPAQALRARQDSSNAAIEAQWADLERFNRQQFANQLAQQGYSPFGEAMRGRQGTVYG